MSGKTRKKKTVNNEFQILKQSIQYQKTRLKQIIQRKSTSEPDRLTATNEVTKLTTLLKNLEKKGQLEELKVLQANVELLVKNVNDEKFALPVIKTFKNDSQQNPANTIAALKSSLNISDK